MRDVDVRRMMDNGAYSRRDAEGRLLGWWDEVVGDLVSRGYLTADEGHAAKLAVSDDPDLRRRPRNYAACYTSSGACEIHRDALSLPPEKLVAICLHELGHVLDRTGRYRDGLPSDDEQRADAIAARAFGTTIAYDPRDMVQTLDAGLPRPRGLR